MSKINKLDQNGYLINKCRRENLQAEYIPILNELIEVYCSLFSNNICSIFVRGSVASGNATFGESDIDMVVVTYRQCERQIRNSINEIHASLVLKYSFVHHIDLDYFTFEELFTSQIVKRYQFILKCLSLNMHGLMIEKLLKDFRLNQETSENISLLNFRMSKLKDRIKIGADSHPTQIWCMQIVKSIVRAGFELCSYKEGFYTRDFKISYLTFVKHFPEMEPKMRLAFELSQASEVTIDQTFYLMDGLGKWLVDEFNKYLASNKLINAYSI